MADPVPAAAEPKVPVRITESGQIGTVPLSTFNARRGDGYYTPISRDEYKRAKFVAAATDEPLEKAQAAAESVGSNLLLNIPDLAAAKWMSPEEFEQYTLRRQSDIGQTAETAANIGAALTGVGAIGKVAVGQAVKQGIKVGTKQAVKAEAKAVAREGIEEVGEQLVKREADDALVAIAQEAGDTPLGKALAKRILGKTAAGAQAIVANSPTAMLTRGAIKAGQAAEQVAGRAGLGQVAQKTIGLGVEGASEAALYKIKENISEASLGKEDLTAERLFAGAGDAALNVGMFTGALGAGIGTLDKAFAKAKHLVPNAQAVDDLNLGGDIAEKAKETFFQTSAKMSGERVEDIRRVFRPNVRADHARQTAVRSDMAERFRKSWDDAHSVDAVQRSILAGELKAQNVAKTVKRGPETLSSAQRMMDDLTSDLLHQNKQIQQASAAAFSKKEYDGLRGAAESARSRMRDALKKGDESEAYLALENLKRDLDGKAKGAKRIKARDTTHQEQLNALAEYAEEEAHRVRRFLEDEETWGLAGRNQAARNAAFHEMMGPLKDVKRRFVTRLDEGAEGTAFDPNTYGTRKIEYADQKKVEGYLGEMRDAGKDIVNNQTARYFDAREKWLDTVINSGELPTELLGDFKKALDATKTARATINEASERIADINLLDDMLKRETERGQTGLGLLGGTAVAGLAGGPKAAAMSAFDHLAKGTISRPGSIARQLAVVDGMAERAAKVDNHVRGKIGGFISKSVKAAKSGAATAGRGITQTGRMARAAAPAAYVEFFGNDPEKRRQKVEKRIDRLFEMSADPQTSLRYAGHITRGMADSAPAVTAAAVFKHRTALEYITSQVRPMGDVTVSLLQPHLARRGYSESEINNIAKMLTVADRPLSILDDLERGTVSPVAVETMKNIYPELYQDTRQKIIEELGKTKTPLTFDATIQLSLFLDLPGHPTLTPEFMQRQAERYSLTMQPQGPAPQSGGGPAPDVARHTATLAESVATNL